MNLYYIHDPMCSWCYAFSPTWQMIKKALSEQVAIKMLLGGLAADSEQTMPDETQKYVRGAWRKIIQEVPGTSFNFEFWNQCEPRRSTYPACRAVLLAREESAEHEEAMINAIQQAYYQNAKNPSDTDVLCELAANIGLKKSFPAELNSRKTQAQLLEEIQFVRGLGVTRFPSLIIEKNAAVQLIPHSYVDAEIVISRIRDELN